MQVHGRFPRLALGIRATAHTARRVLNGHVQRPDLDVTQGIVPRLLLRIRRLRPSIQRRSRRLVGSGVERAGGSVKDARQSLGWSSSAFNLRNNTLSLTSLKCFKRRSCDDRSFQS